MTFLSYRLRHHFHPVGVPTSFVLRKFSRKKSFNLGVTPWMVLHGDGRTSKSQRDIKFQRRKHYKSKRDKISEFKLGKC